MSLRAASVRPTAVAGRFYPDTPAVLRAMVRQMIERETPDDAPGDTIRAMIVPHAGYAFSGPVAASAFRLLGAQAPRFERVVVFGPAHYEPFTGLALPGCGAFATPLGDIAVDSGAAERLLALPYVHVLDSPHAPEHAIEMELPWLIDALGGADRFALVPLLFADTTEDEAAAALDALWDDRTLIVVSSDLSHYLDGDTAQRCDRATADAIVQNQPHAIGPDAACGHVAVRGLMRVAAERGLRCACVDLRNSGDIAPHAGRNRVVGYGAFVYTG